MTAADAFDAHRYKSNLIPGKPAPQDFRDGVATGAANLAEWIRAAERMGIKVTPEIVRQMSDTIRAEIGGIVIVDVIRGIEP